MTEKYPKITVITPSYNQASFISQTIESVISQEYSNLEYIVLDAESNDGSQEIIERYSASISYYKSEKDSGPAEALNKGFKISTGDIICWLNSDDYFEKNTLKIVAHYFLSENINFLYGDCVHFKNRLLRKSWIVKPGELDSDKITYFDPIQQPSAFWSRKVLNEVGFLNEAYQFVFDWDYFIRISKLFEFRYVPLKFSYYRFHEKHKTSTGGIKRSEEILKIVNTYSTHHWKDVYLKVYPYAQELLCLKAKWRSLFVTIFLVKHPRFILNVCKFSELSLASKMLC